ncbi:unnamed protein product [Rotaria sp. Silwood2]|nr:unnamed protein product [Rotaria sp. Silwood2]CAF4380547.1 unnamed protein product [Rotaria sp. Silwood2]
MTTEVSTRIRYQHLFIHFIRNYNLYDDDDELNWSDQLLTTRVFIVTLSIALFMVLSVTAVIPQSRAITVDSPSVRDFENIANRYPNAFTCRCSQISFPYKQFFSFNPRFHQVCSSDLISEEWVSSLFNVTTSNYYPLDFRLMASAQFQVLSALCRIVRNIVSDAVNEFSATIFVSPSALSRTVFDTYTDTLVDQFNKTTLENFRILNGFISFIIGEGHFISALRTNFYTRSVPGSDKYTTFSGIYQQKVNLTQSSFILNETCRCDQTSNCIYPAGIYNQSKVIIPNEAFSNDASLLFVVPGFQVGCVPQNALLQSTLECFYNQSCLDIVITLTGALRTVSALNISNSFSRFDPITAIGDIFDNLMLESWHSFPDFAAYFKICAPAVCSYSYIQRFFFIYMITVAASLFGGLSVALHTGCSLFVKFLSKISCQQTQTLTPDEEREPRRSCRDRAWNMGRIAYEKVTTFNLFKTAVTNVEQGIYSTRVYVLFLMVGIFVLTIYFTKVIVSKQVIVQNPSINQFEELNEMYSSILSCPCSRLSMPRSTFMHYEVQFHPFCTSIFIHDELWLQYFTMEFLNGTIDPTPSFYWIDLRKSGLTFFNYMRILCDFSTTTVSDVLNAFEAENYFSSQPITKLEFNQLTHNWTNSFITQFV